MRRCSLCRRSAARWGSRQSKKRRQYTPQGYIDACRSADDRACAHPERPHQPKRHVVAGAATVHCLTGCAVGEVLWHGVGTSLGLHKAGNVVTSIALAFLFGYALTMRGLLRAGLSWRAAVGIALAADTVSIAVMEPIDNTAMLAIPGAMGAGIASGLF
ncbi:MULTISPECIES: DUF4396 domain-containing protein [unclassified Microbacterium]|uniref:DUF4396 domain-containing protein n=1 Tax=unclassified Microbacterium TaxID=2609290 RepID=UPI001FCE45FD|nr:MULTISPECIES: DUF4396 domain-containing protein [unclassified Microbacterium]